jgi:gliding motility-associated-like protein
MDLTVTSGFGCNSTFSDFIYVAETPEVSITVGDECEGLPIDFTSTATIGSGSIATYQWTFGDGGTSTGQNPTHSYANPGAYNVELTVTSDKGCSATDGPLMANVYPNPVADFFTIQTETRGIETDHVLTFTGSGADQYLWTFYDGQTSNLPGPVKVTFKDQGLKPVSLLVISADGCRDSISKTMLLNPALQMWIINTFSPNSDGLNERFGPSTSCGLSKYSMEVYDRWGAKMYESSDPSQSWDGSDDSGKPAPDGVYAYRIVFRYVDNNIYVYKGTVTLMR